MEDGGRTEGREEVKCSVKLGLPKFHIVADYRAAEFPSVSAFRSDAGTLAISLVRLRSVNLLQPSLRRERDERKCTDREGSLYITRGERK
jgi:hypothetical protein